METNSQIGNRRFRKLVQEFQPTYLLARRKEKPLLARSIVLIIRKRGGRFLKKDDDTGELYEVGDTKAEAKTSQALREGLDVRATKSAASSLLEKKKKKQQEEAQEAAEAAAAAASESGSPTKEFQGNFSSGIDTGARRRKKTPSREQSSPPTLPRLQGEEVKSGNVHPHSPETVLHKASAVVHDQSMLRPIGSFQSFVLQELTSGALPVLELMMTAALHWRLPRFAGICPETIPTAMKSHAVVLELPLTLWTGAATGSFCLGPTGWRR